MLRCLIAIITSNMAIARVSVIACRHYASLWNRCLLSIYDSFWICDWFRSFDRLWM